MNDTGTILIFIGIFLLGGLIGFAIYHFSLGKKRNGVKQQELDETKAELEQYKEKVNDHFMNSAELMQQVATSYQALHHHMANQSESLLGEQGVSPYPLLEPGSPKSDEETLLEETNADETNQVAEEVVTSEDDAVETEQKDIPVEENVASNEVPEAPTEEKAEDSSVPPQAERPKDYVDSAVGANDTGNKDQESAAQDLKTEKKYLVDTIIQFPSINKMLHRIFSRGAFLWHCFLIMTYK
jgi:uncharacterized membrane-anchored protein YhcB (DUF1043 family)